ncbi:MAG: hypothetical protein QOI38_2643 [Sphingomonadales bacterium]|jgi:hypothetical protein|nr:hypothetical protein [Sphingomonadales bacterium]
MKASAQLSANGADSSAAEPWIFVQIPAYRDDELAPTLRDLYHKAADPRRLRVAVFWQRADGEELPRAVRRLPNLELIEVPYQESRGVNWARAHLQRLWQGEAYTMFLDSHHRFAAGWDRTLIGMHRALIAQGVERPMITAYLPPYHPASHPAGRRCSPYRIYPARREDGLLTHLTSHPIHGWRGLAGPQRGDFVSAHFLFAGGDFNIRLGWDPGIYFLGDEVAMSLRAHTHGYDLYHPHRVIGWHCYDRRTRTPHWDDHSGWGEQQRKSLERLRRLFAGRLMGSYGLGRARSRRSFEDRLLIPLVAPPA